MNEGDIAVHATKHCDASESNYRKYSFRRRERWSALSADRANDYVHQMTSRSSASFIRPTHIDVELVKVAYHQRAFPMHIHDEHVIGVVEAGAEMLEVDDASHIISAGGIICLGPGQPHSNRTIGDDCLRYRVFYLPSSLLVSHLDPDRMRFRAPSRPAGDETLRLLALHRWFEDYAGDRLEEQSAIAEVIGIAFDEGATMVSEPQLPKLAHLARDYIDEHYREGFGLDELAVATGASKFHVARSFKRAYGLSPIAYRTQRRIHEAKRLILAGMPLAEVASDLSFADQSHLTRHFQTLVGIAPGRYREQ